MDILLKGTGAIVVEITCCVGGFVKLMEREAVDVVVCIDEVALL